MTDTKTLSMIELGHQLAEIRLAIAALDRHALAPLTAKEAELKAMLQEEMQANGTKTLDVAGLQVQRRVSNAPQIVDEAQLVAALKEKGLYESCLKTSLDRAIAKKIGAANEMPGIEIVASETIAIGKSKKTDDVPF